MEQDQYVKVNIKESVRSQLKEQAKGAGKTLADYIEWLAGQKLDSNPIDEADVLVEKLDKQQEWQVDPLIKDLGPDELPECCQSIYDDPTAHCEHWEDRRPVGYWNKLTHKWANDPDYIQYV